MCCEELGRGINKRQMNKKNTQPSGVALIMRNVSENAATLLTVRLNMQRKIRTKVVQVQVIRVTNNQCLNVL